MAKYHLTMTGPAAGETLCGAPRHLEGIDYRHAAWNGDLTFAPRDVLVGDGCCALCAWTWCVAGEGDEPPAEVVG